MKIRVHQLHRHQQGAGLAELVMAIALATVIVGAVMGLSLYSARSYVAIGNYMDLDRMSRNALDRITREIRQADQLLSFSTNQLVFAHPGGVTITYTYNPNTRTLVRSRTGEPDKVLLTGCDYWIVSRFQRNCVNGNNQFTNATDATTSKLITISWKCSRAILGKNVNTESVQTAQVVIRNQYPMN